MGKVAVVCLLLTFIDIYGNRKWRYMRFMSWNKKKYNANCKLLVCLSCYVSLISYSTDKMWGSWLISITKSFYKTLTSTVDSVATEACFACAGEASWSIGTGCIQIMAVVCVLGTLIDICKMSLCPHKSIVVLDYQVIHFYVNISYITTCHVILYELSYSWSYLRQVCSLRLTFFSLGVNRF